MHPDVHRNGQYQNTFPTTAFKIAGSQSSHHKHPFDLNSSEYYIYYNLDKGTEVRSTCHRMESVQAPEILVIPAPRFLQTAVRKNPGAYLQQITSAKNAQALPHCPQTATHKRVVSTTDSLPPSYNPQQASLNVRSAKGLTFHGAQGVVAEVEVLHPEQAVERAEPPEGKMREPQLDAGLAVPRTRDPTCGEGGSVSSHLEIEFQAQ